MPQNAGTRGDQPAHLRGRDPVLGQDLVHDVEAVRQERVVEHLPVAADVQDRRDVP